MIRVENVSKNFNKTHALKNVSLEVNKGDIISLIGPSGSGKSTLLRCIHGLEHVDSGKIYMDDEWMNSDDEKKFVHKEIVWDLCFNTSIYFRICRFYKIVS